LLRIAVELLHRRAPIEFMSQAIELPPQVAAVRQSIGHNSRGKRELAGQFQTLHRLESTAQMARAIDIGRP
jgi:hypothetical protein